MEYEVKKVVNLADGAHRGVIIDIEYRKEPYEYTDIVIETKTEQGNITLKYGCPSSVSAESRLGRLLAYFGATLEPGQKVDDKQILVGKICSFMTMQEEKDGKKYSRIVEHSVKPAEQ